MKSTLISFFSSQRGVANGVCILPFFRKMSRPQLWWYLASAATKSGTLSTRAITISPHLSCRKSACLMMVSWNFRVVTLMILFLASNLSFISSPSDAIFPQKMQWVWRENSSGAYRNVLSPIDEPWSANAEDASLLTFASLLESVEAFLKLEPKCGGRISAWAQVADLKLTYRQVSAQIVRPS